MKKNEQPKNDSFEKPNFEKEKVGQTSSSSFGQQCFDCQGYGHIKSECPTYLRSEGKAMVVTFNEMKHLIMILIVIKKVSSWPSRMLLDT